MIPAPEPHRAPGWWMGIATMGGIAVYATAAAIIIDRLFT